MLGSLPFAEPSNELLYTVRMNSGNDFVSFVLSDRYTWIGFSLAGVIEGENT